MNMAKWNEWVINQDLLYGWERASLNKAKICIDKANAILVHLLYQLEAM
jgi:hypothetical protein